MGTLLRSCVVVHEPIELSFGVVSGVGLDIHVLDGCPHAQGEGRFLSHWFEWRIF